MDLKWDLKGRPRLEQNQPAQQLNIRYERIQNIGNLRHFYFLQDHTTSDQQHYGEQRQD